MNPNQAPVHASRKGLRWWQWLLAIGGAGFALLITAAVNVVTLTRDAAALRNEIVASLESGSTTTVQVSAGPLLLSLVRGGMHFVDDVPEEARAALQAVRKASVGVYTIDAGEHSRRAEEIFASAETTMARRGWTRVVAVNDGDTQVLVFAPVNSEWTGTQKVCVAVCDEDKLIVVSGTIRPEPLMEIARRRGGVAKFL